ncbi:metal-sulfur cluster assembly factor [Paucilactobacillus suebicus]|uniref:Metal-sulfur cluster biosynthetic protein n=1 Tax=Paucilactobacillus suebicus DSM 5007 = KCTC 3549 TaxID=1423807 RepID=A0A0R1W652_9LACO|nr:metal-sulfur cluster assembly factor [Paucilactobacillus suebicus]KRM13021.1 metal-sulfur cluster biosynthetic protein [Paucilactobacillus suebicus DSM 5007 = KCTC 3549]
MASETEEKDAVTDLQDRMLDQLSNVIDPELRIDLVNLGLIYGLSMTDGVVTVTMTLTMVGCPISQVLQNMIETSLEKLPEVNDVKIKIVWEPAWSPAKMSRYARMALGYHG